MTDLQAYVIALIKAALTGECALPQITPDWGKIVEAVRQHQVFSIAYYGAVNAGIDIPEPYRSALEKYTFQGLAIDQYQIYAIQTLEKEFTDNQLDYMLLKGSLLKFVYPQTDMRTMGDVDILIRGTQYAEIAPIMERLGYTFAAETSHDYEWNGKFAHVELHKSLIPPQNADFYSYFGSGWDKAIGQAGNPFAFTLTDEEQLIYLFAHFVKHYRSSGIGLRHMTDLWVFRAAHPELDENRVLQALQKMELDVFYRHVSETLDNWFAGKPATEVTDFITAYVFESGAYGVNKNRMIFNEAIRGGAGGAGQVRMRHIFRMAFPSLSAMQRAYPILKRCPLLLPFVWVARWFKGLFFKRDRFKQEFEHLNYFSAEDIDRQKRDLAFVGLKYNFKE